MSKVETLFLKPKLGDSTGVFGAIELVGGIEVFIDNANSIKTTVLMLFVFLPNQFYDVILLKFFQLIVELLLFSLVAHNA